MLIAILRRIGDDWAWVSESGAHIRLATFEEVLHANNTGSFEWSEEMVRRTHEHSLGRRNQNR